MTDAKPIIGIVEDDQEFRAYLAAIIGDHDQFELGFSEPTVKRSLDRLAEQPADLCLVDLNLPDGRGVDVIKAVKQAGGKALVLSVLGDRITVMEALGAGADGYLLKSGRPEMITSQIQQTLDGMAPVSPQIAAYLLDLARGHGAEAASDIPSGPQSDLTDREKELLDLFARGLSYRETASAMNISINTVSDHVRNIYTKLDVHSRSEAVFEAQCQGLIDSTRRR